MAETVMAPAKVSISLTVNGKAQTAEVEPRLLLVSFLRDNLGLTGTHIGCDTSQCGACVIHLNGEPVKSCTLFTVQADGAELTDDRRHRQERRTCTRCRWASGRCTACSAATAPRA